MIDILDLNEKSKEWVSDGLEFLTSHLTYGNALELTDRLIAAEKDAARYRWLRDTAHTVTGLTPCAFVMMDGELMEDWNGQYGLLCLGALDAAVDEAKSVNQA